MVSWQSGREKREEGEGREKGEGREERREREGRERGWRREKEGIIHGSQNAIDNQNTIAIASQRIVVCIKHH